MAKNRDDKSQDFIKKALNKYNSLPESIINPLMIGVLFVGIGATVFNPGTVVYLAMVFGASAGMAYAASKNQTAHMPLPTWVITSIGVASAVIYGVAGIPGLMLTAGVSGGWYLNSYFGHRFQQWKIDFQNVLIKFKNNPVRESINLTFNGLQFLADLLISVENIAPAPAQQAEENPPILGAASVPEIIPPPSNAPLVTVATPKPDTAVIRFRGNPILINPKKEIKIDFAKGYGLPSLLKMFFYSLDPMNNFIDINKDKNKDKDKDKAILAITDNTLLEQPTPVIFQRVSSSPLTEDVVAEIPVSSVPAPSTPGITPEAGTRTDNSTPQTCAIKQKPDPVLFCQLPRGMRFFEDMINQTLFLQRRSRGI